MDSVNFSPAPSIEIGTPEQVTYVPPAVVYEAPLEVRAGTPWGGVPDPLNLFGAKE